tara:strand:- start:2751 stop:2882 length:132 start_codon:yes stop_codon:yes gene_type:complete
MIVDVQKFVDVLIATNPKQAEELEFLLSTTLEDKHRRENSHEE